MSVCPLNAKHRSRCLEAVSCRWLEAIAKRDLGFDLGQELAAFDSINRYRCDDCGLEFFEPAIAGSEGFYRRLHALDWYQPDNKFEHRFAADFVRAGDSVLDIGSGTGGFARQLADDLHYAGLDEFATEDGIIQQTLADHAVEHEGAYDCVCAFQVLEHSTDPGQFIKQALACLKPGGRLIVGVPNVTSYVGRLVNFALNAPPHHLTGWSPRAIAYLERHFDLQREALTNAPIEGWERELVSMARLYSPFVTHERRYFGPGLWTLLVPLAYFAAKFIKPWYPKVGEGQGATLVWVARKVSDGDV